MGYVVVGAIGLAMALVARLIVSGGRRIGIVLAAVLGVGGALIAAWAGEWFGWYATSEPSGFIAAAIVAFLLLAAAGRMKVD